MERHPKVPEESRRLSRADQTQNGPSGSDIPEPITTESCEYWIHLGLISLRDAFIFGCVVVGIIFLAFALYNAWCDPFQYLNIFFIGFGTYLFFLVLALLLSYLFGILVGRFNGTGYQSAAQSNNSTQQRNLRISTRVSSTIAANNTIEESRTVDKVAQEFQAGRNLSGTVKPYSFEPEGRNGSSTPPIEQLYQTPRAPRVNEVQRRSDENLDRENNEQSGQPAEYDDNEWFNRQHRGGPLIPSDFPACTAERMRMNALRCTATGVAESVPIRTITGTYEPQVIIIDFIIRRNDDGTNQVIILSNSSCRRTMNPTTVHEWTPVNGPAPPTILNYDSPHTNAQQPRICHQPTTFQHTRTTGQPTIDRQNNNCRLRSQTRQLSPQTCASGTRGYSNPLQGRNDNSNPEGNPRVFRQPGPCGLNLSRPAEFAFFRTDD